MNVVKRKGTVYDPGLCRCCGTMKKCRLLTEEYEANGAKEIYSDMIMDCFGLLLSYLDSKPTERLICASCVHRLRDAASFKKQVLQYEEAFLQMKVYDNKFEGTKSVADKVKVEVEVVKTEPHSPGASTRADDDLDHAMDQPDTPEPGEALDSTPEAAEAPDSVKLAAIEDSSEDIPLKQLAKRPLSVKPLSTLRLIKKKVLPMAKVQQIIRESDSSYKIQCNTSTIVEYSYVCPFKCRHNHLICYYCGEYFQDPTLMRKHYNERHSPKDFIITESRKHLTKIDITRIDCRLCSMKIVNLEDFKKHIINVHDKKYYMDTKESILPFTLNKDNWSCVFCSAKFPYFHALNKHMNVHYSNYVCETCGLGFVDKGRFLMHKQRHETAAYPCPTCGKVFNKEYNRELHIDRVHNKRGRIYCPKCELTFMSYQKKLAHLVEAHGEAPLSLPCADCGVVYASRRTLTIHRRKVHLKDYRYECQVCGQKFFTRFALTNHMPTHTGERNFKCKVCEKAYPRLKTLKEHMRIHNNDRRYRCHICGQAFIQNCSLKGHMKSQHPEYG